MAKRFPRTVIKAIDEASILGVKAGAKSQQGAMRRWIRSKVNDVD